MAYELRGAQRSQAKPLIGIQAESGGGKTYSALLLARGFVGPTGRIAMIETETGRGEAYADPAEYPELASEPPGTSNYDVVSLRDDYSPRAYGDAMTVCEKAGVDALIIDSASHEWEGRGGVLQMAGANMEAGKKGVQAWHKPKDEHKVHFMLRFMQSPIPLVILCMRAKYRMQEVPKQGGGKEWRRSENLDPIQADDILYEMFIHGWLRRDDHAFHLNRCTAKALEPVFGGGQPITLETGQQLAAWAAGQKPAAPASAVDERLPGLQRDALEAADKGSVELNAWWRERTRTEKEKLKTFMVDSKIKEQAAQADEKMAREAGGDVAAEAAANAAQQQADLL